MGKGLKVVLVTAYFPPETKGGAEISTYLLARGLHEKRKSRAIARELNRQKDLLEAADIVHANDFRSGLGLMEWRRMFQGSGAPIIATNRDYAVCSGSTNFITASGDLPADSIQDAY